MVENRQFDMQQYEIITNIYHNDCLSFTITTSHLVCLMSCTVISNWRLCSSKMKASESLCQTSA